MKTILYMMCILFSGCTLYQYNITNQGLVNIQSEIEEKKLPKSCVGLEKLVNEQWFFDKKYGYYIYDYHFKETLYKEYGNCISKLSIDKIIQIFGKPNLDRHGKTQRFICYYENSLCDKAPICQAITFFYDGNKTIMGINCTKDWYEKV